MKTLQKLIIVTAIIQFIMSVPLLMKNFLGISFGRILSGGFTTQMLFLLATIIYVTTQRLSFREIGFRLTKLKYVGWGFLLGSLESIVSLVTMVLLMSFLGSGEEASPKSKTEYDFLIRVFQVWIVASSCEEIFFRGFVYHFFKNLKAKGFYLTKRIFISMPTIIATILFSSSHFILLAKMPYQVVLGVFIATNILGIVAGVLREKSGSLIPAYTAHLMGNAVSCLIGMM